MIQTIMVDPISISQITMKKLEKVMGKCVDLLDLLLIKTSVGMCVLLLLINNRKMIYNMTIYTHQLCVFGVFTYPSIQIISISIINYLHYPLSNPHPELRHVYPLPPVQQWSHWSLFSIDSDPFHTSPVVEQTQ